MTSYQKKSPPRSKAATVVIDLVSDNSQSQSLAEPAVTSSSSMLKRHEEVIIKKDQGTSPDPTLSIQEAAVASSSHLRQEVQQPQDNGIRESISANSDFFYSPMYRR